MIEWFDVSGLVANPAKFQVMFFRSKISPRIFHIGNINLRSCDKLLGIYIDDKLLFREHVDY